VPEDCSCSLFSKNEQAACSTRCFFWIVRRLSLLNESHNMVLPTAPRFTEGWQWHSRKREIALTCYQQAHMQMYLRSVLNCNENTLFHFSFSDVHLHLTHITGVSAQAKCLMLFTSLHFFSNHTRLLHCWWRCWWKNAVVVDGAPSVPSKRRKCAVPPDHLRSEISFQRSCNIQNLTSHKSIYCIALSPHEMLHWWCVCMVEQLHAHYNKRLLSVNFS